MYNKSNEQNQAKLKGQGCKGVLQGSKDVIVKHTDRKQTEKVKTEDPSTSGRNDTAGRGGPMILISNHIYIYIVYFIFLFYHISIKCILPIELCINSMLDKYNIYSVVDVLHSDDLFLLICIRLLDFPQFVLAPSLCPLEQ